MKPLKLLFITIVLSLSSKLSAQSFFEHEIGINGGFYQLRSDYGERFDRETNSGNQGTTFALTYYLNRASRRRVSYFMEHVKYRIDLIYSSVDLQHYGRYADAPVLQAMTGSFSNIGLSTGIEYFPFGIRMQTYNQWYSFGELISPYAGVAVGLNYVSPDAESSLEGGLNNPANVFPTFVGTDVDNGIVLDSRAVLSLNLRLGLRFNLGKRDGILLESSWMLFGSDLVDGIKPVGPQNKYTDWSWGINIGYTRLFF
jgi:hypothetical protein